MTAIATRHPARLATETMWSPPTDGSRGVREMEITPAFAKHLLAFNTHNRNYRERLATKYARDMAAGRWMFNTDGIGFDVHGRLTSGQHRLHAIIIANVPIRFLVAWGLHPDTRYVTDIGSTQKASDMFTLKGKKNVIILGSCLRMLARWDNESGLAMSRSPASNAELDALLTANPDVEDAVSFVIGDRDIRNLTAASVLAFAYLLFSRIDQPCAAEFFHTMATGANLTNSDPRLILARQLRNIGSRGSASASSQRVVLAYVIKAWNAWRNGETPKLFRWVPNEPFPIPH